MPLRKRKGRRKPKSPASRQAKEDTPDVIPDEAKDVVETEGGAQPKRASTRSETLQTVGDGSGDGEMDEEERRARETIALLAKKYQVQSISLSGYPGSCAIMYMLGETVRGELTLTGHHQSRRRRGCSV